MMHTETLVLEFQREKITDEFLSSLLPLLVDNFDETAIFQDLDMNPDFDIYRRLEAYGCLRIFTARLGGELVGYSIFNVGPHTHFKGITTAKEEVIFISQPHRGRAGLRFIDFIDESLKNEGVDVIFRSITDIRDWSKVLLRKGYVFAEKVYAKRTR